jgi:hypothetical protein
MTIKIKHRPRTQDIKAQFTLLQFALVTAAQEKYASLPEQERKLKNRDDIINQWITEAANKLTANKPTAQG